jgi:glycosyltransferase involved in cell wall biosynthesis
MSRFSDPMRIGLIHWAFPPTTGGVESHLADLARILALTGCSVTVITGESSPVLAKEYDIVATSVLNLAWLRENTVSSEERFRRTYGELRKIIRRRRLNVIHGHNLHHFATEPALALEQLHEEFGLRVYHTFHETWPDLLQPNPVYRKWDGNFAVSRFVQEQCFDQLGFRPQLLPLGVDLSRFRSSTPAFTSFGTPVILHPARLLPWKGVHISIEIIANLRKRGHNAKLVLTDAQRIIDWNHELTAYRTEIEHLISINDLSDRVEFRTVTYEQMPALYNQADLVVYPTVSDEPYGLVPLEAMACERPILASRSGGIVETVVHSKTGYVIERGDIDSFGEFAARLLANPAQARSMGSAGRRHVEANFNGERYVNSLVRQYCLVDREAKQKTVRGEA